MSEQPKLAACACGGAAYVVSPGDESEAGCLNCRWRFVAMVHSEAVAEWNRVMGAYAALREIAGATLNRSDTSAAMVGQILAKHGVKFDV